MTDKAQISRRDFIKLTVMGGSGLMLGFNILANPTSIASAQDVETIFEPNAYLKIDTDGIITISVFHTEMGQGVQTAIPMIIAEELDADWSKIQVEQAEANPIYGDQGTAGSASISESYTTLRRAGAAARALLLAAAAQTWNVEADSCYTSNGYVIHRPSDNRLSYGELVESAAQLPVVNSVPLKDPADFQIIGTRVSRIDNDKLVTGRAIYAIDVQVPGMLYATVARCPIFGGQLLEYDDSKARAIAGVRQIIPISSGIAVIADNTWAAMQGQRALQITWDGGEWSELNSETIEEMLTQAVESLADDSGRFEAVYKVPYQAHATMEPMNCVADVREDACEVWVPTQNRQDAQRIAQRITGLSREKVKIYVTYVGGGFGRRIDGDYVEEAVEISQAIAAPVKLVWTRPDDIQHDFYRPASHHLMRAEFDEDGLLQKIEHRIIGQDFYSRDGSAIPYQISNSVSNLAQSLPIPVGAWRAVGNCNNAFAVESFIDELAIATGKDPYEFRIELLSKRSRLRPDQARMRAVLERVAIESQWSSPLPDGWGRGIACHSTWNATPVAQVVELSVTETGTIRVHRVVCVVDCGVAVNPDMIDAQMEGGIVFGLTAALKSEITLANGRVEQSNFHDFPLLRFDEMPLIEVHIMPSDESPSGVGEMAVPPLAPALANAIFAATGKRIRHLPIRAEDLL